MKVSEFKQFIRVMVPSATLNRVSDAFLLTCLNKAVREVNQEENILTGEFYFDATEDDKDYPVKDIDSSIIKPGKGGVWYNRGSVASTYYDQLESVNRIWLDEKYPNWVNDGGDNPQFTFYENGVIYIYSSPGADLTDGLWLPDAVVAPVDMTADDHYPFTGSTTERKDLEPLDDAIIDYVRFILKHAVGSDQKGLITREEFRNTLKESAAKVRSRPDYESSKAWERGRAVG